MHDLKNSAAFVTGITLLALVFATSAMAQSESPAKSEQPAQATTGADARADAIAGEVMAALGGQEAWDRTRFLSWAFYGRRQHYWDRYSGDVRVEDEDRVILMNIQKREGRAWVGGTEITAADSLSKLLDRGYALWVNDSYWVFMPYKLKDPGVQLRYAGERAMEDGRMADVLEMTFENVGRTPENKYEVCVDKETRLIGEWTYYANMNDPEPRFTGPWAEWKRIGSIMLATSHGRDKDWKLAVHATLPRSVFESPDPVMLESATR